jgi:hypothetical protein
MDKKRPIIVSLPRPRHTEAADAFCRYLDGNVRDKKKSYLYLADLGEDALFIIFWHHIRMLVC